MKKTLKKAFGILALSALIPISAWAAGGPPAEGKFQGPHQQSINACVGKQAGDTVQWTTPRGNTVSAICQEFDGKLAARPERKDKHLGRGKSRCRHERNTGMGPGMMGMGFGGDHRHLLAALHLTPEQKTKIKEIMNTEHQKNAQLREQLRNSRDSFWSAVSKTPYDEAAVRKIAQELEPIRTELILSWASAMNQALAVLTPEQQETAAKIGIFRHGMGPHRYGFEKDSKRGMCRNQGGHPQEGKRPVPDNSVK